MIQDEYGTFMQELRFYCSLPETEVVQNQQNQAHFL
nr:MAG TPA: hypothetical protein [Caudoviricetes sp.]